MRQVGSYLGYTGHPADVVATAAFDPEQKSMPQYLVADNSRVGALTFDMSGRQRLAVMEELGARGRKQSNFNPPILSAAS